VIVVPAVPLNLNLKLSGVHYESFIVITCLEPSLNYFHDALFVIFP